MLFCPDFILYLWIYYFIVKKNTYIYLFLENFVNIIYYCTIFQPCNKFIFLKYFLCIRIYNFSHSNTRYLYTDTKKQKIEPEELLLIIILDMVLLFWKFICLKNKTHLVWQGEPSEEWLIIGRLPVIFILSQYRENTIKD